MKHNNIISMCKDKNWSELKSILTSNIKDSSYKILITAVFETYHPENDERLGKVLKSWNKNLCGSLPNNAQMCILGSVCLLDFHKALIMAKNKMTDYLPGMEDSVVANKIMLYTRSQPILWKLLQDKEMPDEVKNDILSDFNISDLHHIEPVEKEMATADQAQSNEEKNTGGGGATTKTSADLKSKEISDNSKTSYPVIFGKLSSKPPLTPDQEKALQNLSQLQPYGFTAEQLRQWQYIFYNEHLQALLHLCKTGYSSDKAIIIVNGLEICEAAGVANGLTREEVLGLQEAQINTLLELKKEGLTAQHLRHWQDHEFSLSHHQALKVLIQEKGKSPQVAIEEIKKMDSNQAEGIAKGLSCDEVLGLNRAQIKTLLDLQKLGLTAQHLRSWQGQEKDEFSRDHQSALTVLIHNQQKTPEAAIAEINGLNSSQAKGIAKGLTRDDVIGLSEYQISTLSHLRQYPRNGLTAKHLRSWQGKHFSVDHKDALIDLIEKRSFKPEDAIAEISGLDNFEARTIFENKLTRHDVAGFNGWQINLLSELKSFGLTPTHMRSWKKSDDYFGRAHTDALIALMKHQGFKPEAAIDEINGLEKENVARIAKGETRAQVLSKRPAHAS